MGAQSTGKALTTKAWEFKWPKDWTPTARQGENAQGSMPDVTRASPPAVSKSRTARPSTKTKASKPWEFIWKTNDRITPPEHVRPTAQSELVRPTTRDDRTVVSRDRRDTAPKIIQPQLKFADPTDTAATTIDLLNRKVSSLQDVIQTLRQELSQETTRRERIELKLFQAQALYDEEVKARKLNEKKLESLLERTGGIPNFSNHRPSQEETTPEPEMCDISRVFSNFAKSANDGNGTGRAQDNVREIIRIHARKGGVERTVEVVKVNKDQKLQSQARANLGGQPVTSGALHTLRLRQMPSPYRANPETVVSIAEENEIVMSGD